MKPFIVLIGSFFIALISIQLGGGGLNIALSGSISMAIMLLFTSIGHFKFAKGMSQMLPNRFPFKNEAVYFTGIVEILAAIGLLIPNMRTITGWLLIVFFILILPANINAALHHIDYEKGTSDGKGVKYLWFRIPLQILFIAWTYFAAVKGW